MKKSPLVDAITLMTSRGSDSVGNGVTLRTGTVIANRVGATDANLVGIRVGAASSGASDDASTVVNYYDIPTLVVVTVGDVVFWLQTDTGFGLVLGKKR
jgi:hypothetical protein